MKKRILPLLAAALLMLTIAVGAVESREAHPDITLTFQGTTAICVASIYDPGKQISGTLELWCGSTLVASWQKNGTSRVSFDQRVSVTSGQAYRLTLSGTSGGQAISRQSYSAKCP